MKRIASSILLTALLASGIALAQSQAASSVTLELFAAKPNGSSQAISSLEIGAGGANLKSIEMPNTSKARFLRANVTDGSGVKSFVYRMIAAPSNGRIFILTPERKAIALNKFLASTGLEVSADKTVTLGAQVDFASSNATVMDSSSEASMVAGSTTEASTSSTASTTPAETTTPATTTTATDSSTTESTPADASATAPETTTPATDPSTTAPTTEASTTPATTATTEASTIPATTATPDASATPADSSTTPATDANATPATPAADATAATPATATPASSTATTTEAAALTAPVSTTVGKVELTVILAGATAPASSETNLILAPVADATEATSSVDGNMVTLSYTSSSSLEDVSKFYDDQLKAQGFTPDDANTINQKSADQFVKVYKRGTASMTVSVKNENGAYQVEVDLKGLASGT